MKRLTDEIEWWQGATLFTMGKKTEQNGVILRRIASSNGGKTQSGLKVQWAKDDL